MITCRELISFLIDYLDGALPEAERKRFEEHLAVCDSCLAYLHTYEMTIRMEKVSVVEESDIPEELIEAVLASRNR